MILFVSGRCDIPAFYSDWFYHRLEAGFVDVRNPYNPHQISRIYLNRETVDVIIFCTKNPIPMLSRLSSISFPFLFHVTLTPYHQDIERHVVHKTEILKAIHTLSSSLGKKRVVVRYDPILLTAHYDIAYHERAFAHLCAEVSSSVETIIISFVDMYKNTRMNAAAMKIQQLKEKDMIEIGKRFGRIAHAHDLHVQTCAETIDLSAYGIHKKPCMEWQQLMEATSQYFPKPVGNGVRRQCDCLPSVDIGDYNCCLHECLYCYANYDAKAIKQRSTQHDPRSSVLIGHIEKEDVITIRKEKKNRQITLKF